MKDEFVSLRIIDPFPLHYSPFLHSYKFNYVNSGNSLNKSTKSYGCTDAAHLVSDLSSFTILSCEDCTELISWSIVLAPYNYYSELSIGISDDVKIEFTAKKTYLHRESQPPDSSRGMDVLPTVIYASPCNILSSCLPFLSENISNRTEFSRDAHYFSGIWDTFVENIHDMLFYHGYERKRTIHFVSHIDDVWTNVYTSGGGTITMPFPDSTMPFNVITLASNYIYNFVIHH